MNKLYLIIINIVSDKDIKKIKKLLRIKEFAKRNVLVFMKPTSGREGIAYVSMKTTFF
jgi:hypothetical protein